MPILPHVYLYAHVCGTNRTLYGWAETWQLNSNITKCYDLGITNKVVPFSHNYLINDIVIAKSASTKYPGVTIGHNLNWSQHCDNICSRRLTTCLVF